MINDILSIAERQLKHDESIKALNEAAREYHTQYRMINRDKLRLKANEYLKAYRGKNAGMIAETQRSYYQRKKAKQND